MTYRPLRAFVAMVAVVILGPSGVVGATGAAAGSPPGPVRDLGAAFNHRDELGYVHWDFPTVDRLGVIGFDVRIDGDLVVAGTPELTYRFPLPTGASAVAEVRAVGDGGVPGAWSSVIVYGARAPSIPVITSVTARSGTVSVTWEPADGGGFPVDGYDVRIGDQRAFVDGDVLGWSADGFSPGDEVVVKVRSRNVVAWSWFERRTITVTEPTPAPGPVVGLTYEYDAPDRIVVVWDPPTSGGEVVGYAVEATDRPVSTVPTAARRHELSLGRGRSADVVVRAVGQEADGPGRTITVRAGTEPDAPLDLSATAAADGAIDVGWSTADDGGFPIEAYVLHVDGSERTLAASSTTVRLHGLEVGTNVEVELRARNVLGTGPPARATVTLPEPPAEDPGSTEGDDEPPTTGEEPPVAGPPTVDPAADRPPAAAPPRGDPVAGYWVADAAGSLFEFGSAAQHRDVGGSAVALGTDATGAGLWILTVDGTVHVRGGATHHGDVHLGLLGPRERVASISVRPAGDGYWVFTDRGRALAFGAARSFGDMSDVALNGRIVASAATASGDGYWMVGADGGIFSFGDASFHGSTGSLRLNEPVVAIAPDPDGTGYWLVAADGGIFAFDAAFRGSVPGVLPVGASINAPVIGALAFGNGYLMVAADGGIFNFSDEDFLGSLGGQRLGSPVVGVAAFTG